MVTVRRKRSVDGYDVVACGLMGALMGAFPWFVAVGLAELFTDIVTTPVWLAPTSALGLAVGVATQTVTVKLRSPRGWWDTVTRPPIDPRSHP